MRSELASLLVVLTALVLGGCGSPYVPARSEADLRPPIAPGAPEAPPTSPLEHRSGFFEGAGHAKLFEQSWRDASARPRAALVVVHGLKDHGSRYRGLAEALAPRGIAVHALDLRGHAHSEGRRVAIEDFDQYVEDVAIFTARVQAEHPNEPVFLFGHSMGGAIATLVVLEKRPAIRGLVLSGAALAAPGFFTRGGVHVTNALAPSARVFQLDLEDFSRDPNVVREGRADPLVYQPAAPAHTANEVLGAIAKIDDAMNRLDVPTLILHGDADKVTPPEGSRALYRRASSADKSLKLYPRLYHDLLHEPERALVIGDIATWIEARLSRGETAAAEGR